jgi:hypothetical protein
VSAVTTKLIVCAPHLSPIVLQRWAAVLMGPQHAGQVSAAYTKKIEAIAKQPAWWVGTGCGLRVGTLNRALLPYNVLGVSELHSEQDHLPLQLRDTLPPALHPPCLPAGQRSKLWRSLSATACFAAPLAPTPASPAPLATGSCPSAPPVASAWR